VSVHAYACSYTHSPSFSLPSSVSYLDVSQQNPRWVVRGQSLLDNFCCLGSGGDPTVHASVNWMSSNGDILFHFNPRPAWNRIYFDSRINGVFSGDQTLPLVGDLSLLEWTVMVDDAGFHVIDRGSEVLVRPHRAPWSSFTACQYTNGVTLPPMGNDGLPVPVTTPTPSTTPTVIISPFRLT
jgi:hypothetical protein